MNFEELSDGEWNQIAALVSDEPPIRLNRRGRPRAEPRVVTNAVLWILTTGESWSRLPARYPSGPTCRRRFDEWHANGTLLELVKVLSEGGRAFVYVPDVAPAGANGVAQNRDGSDDDGQPAVYWKSPEAWQASGASASAAAAADAIDSMTRHLASAATPDADTHPSGRAIDADALAYAHADAPGLAPARRPMPGAALPLPGGMPAVNGALPAAGGNAALLARTMSRATVPAHADGAEPRPLGTAPLWTSNAAQQYVQAADWRGYTLNLSVQPVRNRMFRAAVEILRDGLRVERSGLVGPAFTDREAAKQFAFDWGCQWVDRVAYGGNAAPLVGSGAGMPLVGRVPGGGTPARQSGHSIVTRSMAAASASGTPSASFVPQGGPRGLPKQHLYPSPDGVPTVVDPRGGNEGRAGGPAEQRIAIRAQRSHAG